MNFTDTPPVPIPREFLAVILAGFGNELLPLTGDNGDEVVPKALLPIANKPMISYPLMWLEESGVKDALLICPTIHRAAISHHVHSDPSSSAFSSLNIDIQAYEEIQDDNPGTCTVLKHFAHRIHGDFILLPCDFVPPPKLPLSIVLDKFRLETATDGAVLTSLWYEHLALQKDKGGADDTWASPTTAPRPIVYDKKSGTLLHVDTLDDADENDEEMELRMGMLWKYPQTKLVTNLQDSHVYVCRRQVLDVLAQKPSFDSIREELIPWLCKVHTQKTRREKYGYVLSTITNQPASYGLALHHSTTHTPRLKSEVKRAPSAASEAMSLALQRTHSQSSAVTRDYTTEYSSTAPPSPTLTDFEAQDEASLRCGLIVHRLSDGFAARANNIQNYQELNRQALVDLPPTTHDAHLIDAKSNISNDSIVGSSTKVAERASVKKSTIGRHCVIGKYVKITNSVLMDHCVIDDGAKIEGCVLGINTHIGGKAELSRCVTQSGYEAEAGAVYKQERLEVSDWTAEPVKPEEEGSEEESEEEGTGEGSEESEEDD